MEAMPSPALEALEADVQPAPEAINVLLVDDQPEGLLALEAVLEPLGQNLVRASSGREALRLLLKDDYALILLDVVMPDVDGLETAALIRARERTRTTPIIFLTAARKDEGPLTRAYEAGGVDFIYKPINPDVLRSKVRVFVELARKAQLLRRQSEALHEAQRREHEQQMAEALARHEASRLRREMQERTAHIGALQRAEAELQRAVRARDDFISAASHELNTPLTTIVLQLDSLERGLRKIAGGDDPRVVRTVATLSRNVERLARLIAELLDVSRLAEGRLKLELEQVDLVEVVCSVAERFEEEMARAGCALQLEASQPVTGLWDRSRLDQVVTNLLTNALKYAPGEPIEISVRGYEQAGHLLVRDHGIGIPKENQARIFERFERAVPAENYSGLGLGLWIVHRIVGELGGTVGVQSEPGQGATFIVALPRQFAAPRPREIEAER
jgi:signal transduction histidine kinase